jgi:hypothetical protein
MTHISNIQNHNRYLERRAGTKIIKEMERTAGGVDMNGSIQNNIHNTGRNSFAWKCCVFIRVHSLEAKTYLFVI